MKTKRVSAYAVAAFAAAIVTSTVSAKTVAWYHFDELEPGTRATKTTTFLNAADPTKYVGKAVTYNHGTVTDSASLYPLSVEGIPQGWRIYDPVSGSRCATKPGLLFYPQGVSDDNCGRTGTVTIDDDESLHAKSFTVELFARKMKWHEGQTDETTSTLEQMLVTKQVVSSSSTTTFSLKFTSNGRVFANVAYYDETKTLKGVQFYNESTYDDKKWHHIALTYNGDTRVATLYVDYAQTATTTLPFDIAWGTCPIVVGHNPGISWGGAGIFQGDELRFSDTVLTKDQFLQAEAIVDEPPVLPETVIYQRFADLGIEPVAGRGTNLLLNEAPRDVSFGNPALARYGADPAYSDDVIAPLLGTGNALSASVANGNSVALRATAESLKRTDKRYAPNWYWSDPPATLSEDDFTVEFILRFPEKDDSQVYFFSQQSAAYFSYSVGRLQVNWKNAFTTRIDDGKWHQIAMVYEKSVPRVRVYVDYKLRKTWEGTSAELALPFGTSKKPVNVGAYEYPHLNETIRNLDIDELRVTRKALALGEMLHPARKDILCDLGFETEEYVLGPAFGAAPDLSGMAYSVDTVQKAGPLTGEGPFEGIRENTASAKLYASGGKAGGIVLEDPEMLMATNSFTAEACFRIEPGAHVNFADDCVYVFCQNSWYVRLNQNGMIRFCGPDYHDIATVASSLWSDGKWHHLGYVCDRGANDGVGELRVYFDYRLVGTHKAQVTIKSGKLFIGNGLWYMPQYCFREGWLDNIRVTLKALEPMEFVNIHPVTGDTLFWTTLDAAKADVETHLEHPVETSAGTFVRGNAGKVVDAEGTLLRANGGSVSLASGALSYSRLSLLERKDQTVEFFLKAGAAADGADLVSLAGADASKPIWSLRNVGGTLKVVVTDGNGAVTEVVSAGALPVRWAHFAISFEPAADGSSTTVTVYRDHALFGASATFAGTLAVDGLATSTLKVAKFDGQLDELRVSKGTLPVADMLYGLRTGLFFIVR